MAEQDRFERRLRDAIGRYVADAPGDFDAFAFARDVAAAEPRRRGWFAVVPGTRAGAVPRLAWLLLLGALLLAAAAGIVAGTALLRQNELSVVPAPTVAPVATLAPLPGQATAAFDLAGEVTDLAVAPDGGVWAATGRGVLHWDPADGSARLYGTADGLPDAAADRTAIGADGAVWARGGDWLARFDGSWTTLAGPDALGGIEVTSLGGMAVDAAGRLWVAADTSAGAKLLRVDGRVTVVDVPESVVPLGSSNAYLLTVTPSGEVWATLGQGGIAVWDGATWTVHANGSAGLPQTPWQAAVGADGTIWAELGGEGCSLTVTNDVSCTEPPAGLARFDGMRWRVYTTADGLADDDAYPYAGPDGTVWAVHRGGAASRWDGTRWIAFDDAGVVERSGATVAPDGSLWSWSPAGVVRFDGRQATAVTVPIVSLPVAQPALTLARVAGPETAATPIGDVTWRAFETPDYALLDVLATSHSLVAVDGRSGLRWSADGETWQGISLSIPSARFLAADGDDVLAFGSGAARARWDGRGWAEVERLEIEDGLYAEEIVSGPRAAVLTSRTSVLFSVDGRRFVRAARGPDPDLLEPGWTDRDSSVGGCSSNGWGSGPGEGRVGPVIVTADGFIALTAGHPADWNRDPMCQPVLWSSSDGSHWELLSRESPFGAGAYVTDVASREGRHVAVGGRGGTGIVWVSDDGRGWRRLDLHLGEVAAVTAGDAGWILLEPGFVRGQGWVSADGLTWERVPSSWPGVSTLFPSISVGPGTIAAVGRWKLPDADEWISAVVLGTVEP